MRGDGRRIFKAVQAHCQLHGFRVEQIPASVSLEMRERRQLHVHTKPESILPLHTSVVSRTKNTANYWPRMYGSLFKSKRAEVDQVQCWRFPAGQC